MQTCGAAVGVVPCADPGPSATGLHTGYSAAPRLALPSVQDRLFDGTMPKWLSGSAPGSVQPDSPSLAFQRFDPTLDLISQASAHQAE